LIAATNLTNLFLASSTARRQELAVRLSLGAPASRIRRELLLESLLLASAGTLAGFALAKWLASALQIAASATDGSPIRIDTSLDWRMFTFLSVVLLAVVLISALVPAFSAARVPPHEVLKGQAGGTSSIRFRRGLIAFQTALSLTLLGGTGLMLSSLRGLAQEATGFQNDRSVFLTPDLFNAGISREGMPRAYESILAKMRAQPNVISAAWTRTVPLTGGLSTYTVEVPGRSDLTLKQRTMFWHQISDGYFAAAGIPILAGRDLPPVASGRKNLGVISENAARRFFGSPQDAVGRRLKPGEFDWIEVTGVVADSKYHNIREEAPLTLYIPQGASLAQTLVVGFRGPAQPVIAVAQRLFQQEAGRLPVIQIRTVGGNISESVRTERLLTWLLGGFAGFALVISATGLSGLLLYWVAQRRKDLGIRIALGATPHLIRREILGQALMMTSAGLICGALLSYALRRSLDSYLYGIAATHPAIWTAGSVILLLVALVAAAIPAWRASQIDPAAMLRGQ